MNKCDCYHKETLVVGYEFPNLPVRKAIGVCYGTKEREECTCGGDKHRCNFYPEKREEREPVKVYHTYIDQLEGLKAHCEDMAQGNGSGEWQKDVDALDWAIDFIRKASGTTG